MTVKTPTKNKTGHGKIFEKELMNSFPYDMYIQRMKDDTMKFKNVQNPCDFIAYQFPKMFLLEAKTTKQKSLPFNNIHRYQIDSLYHHSKQPGIIAGFVLNFRSTDEYETYFVSAEVMHDFYYNADRKSFPLEWVQRNGIQLKAIKKRTRYTFDLEPLLSIPLPKQPY